MRLVIQFIIIGFLLVTVGGAFALQPFIDIVPQEQTHQETQEFENIEEDDFVISMFGFVGNNFLAMFYRDPILFYKTPSLRLVQRPPKTTH